MGQNARMTDRPTAYLYDLLGEPVTYDRAAALQLDLAAARSQGAIPDTVILLEHPPTLTIGRSTDVDVELPLGAEGYQALGWDVVTTPRGGRATFHGPGQLVGYPILDLRAHGQDLRRYAHDLERVLVLASATSGSRRPPARAPTTSGSGPGSASSHRSGSAPTAGSSPTASRSTSTPTWPPSASSRRAGCRGRSSRRSRRSSAGRSRSARPATRCVARLPEVFELELEPSRSAAG